MSDRLQSKRKISPGRTGRLLPSRSEDDFITVFGSRVLGPKNRSEPTYSSHADRREHSTSQNASATSNEWRALPTRRCTIVSHIAWRDRRTASLLIDCYFTQIMSAKRKESYRDTR